MKKISMQQQMEHLDFQLPIEKISFKRLLYDVVCNDEPLQSIMDIGWNC